MHNDNNNNSSANNGNRGRFSDRLKKIRRDRLNKKKNYNLEGSDESVLKHSGRNILKVILAIPSIIYTNIKDDKKKKTSVLNKKESKSVHIDNSRITSIKFNDRKVSDKQLNNDRKIKINKIREIDVSLLMKQQELYFRDNDKNKLNTIVQSTKTISTEMKLQKLQKEIIDLIKKRLVKNINELEILQSEIYILNQFNSNKVYLTDCQQDIKEIKKLLSKIKSLKEKYDYLQDNVDFEYMLEYGDDLLIDKILELKELCSNDDVRYMVDNYKILDEYKFLYLKIDKLQDDTVKYEEYKNKKVKELKQRDIDFEKLKSDIYDIDRDRDGYFRFVKEQELFLNTLEDKISNIDSYEKTTYKLKGFNRLLGNSFKYLGLLLVNPLKGLIPGIATQTLVTKNVINNLYNNLEWEESRKMIYEAIDYSMSINFAINDLDSTSSLIDSTLEEIISLKRNYIEKFSQYENTIYGYRDAIKKINKIENALLGNKIKINIMKQRMIEKEKQNNDKLKMVKKLNSSSNN